MRWEVNQEIKGSKYFRNFCTAVVQYVEPLCGTSSMYLAFV